MMAPTCPVADLAREVVRLIEAYRLNDEAHFRAKDGAEKVRCNQKSHWLGDRQDALEELAARTRARSAEGAMFQLMVVALEVESLEALAHRSNATDAARAERKISACLYSVLRVLEALSGTPADAVAVDYYMAAYRDPHPVLEAAVGGR